jgi:hypothetical protein
VIPPSHREETSEKLRESKNFEILNPGETTKRNFRLNLNTQAVNVSSKVELKSKVSNESARSAISKKSKIFKRKKASKSFSIAHS